MNNLLSYCGLVAVRISAYDKDLPVSQQPANNAETILPDNSAELWAAQQSCFSLSNDSIHSSQTGKFLKIYFLVFQFQFSLITRLILSFAIGT